MNKFLQKLLEGDLMDKDEIVTRMEALGTRLKIESAHLKNDEINISDATKVISEVAEKLVTLHQEIE